MPPKMEVPFRFLTSSELEATLLSGADVESSVEEFGRAEDVGSQIGSLIGFVGSIVWKDVVYNLF